MLFPIKSFDEVVKETKSLGNLLMHYSHPKVSKSDDECIQCLKAKEITVDGYSVVIYYSKNDWPEHYMEVLQITGKYVPFLPFSLICKIGKKFFGEKHLSFVDFLKEDRKTYCWTFASDKSDNPIPVPYKAEVLLDDREYEGLFYKCVNPA
jgi:hypothetical protein